MSKYISQFKQFHPAYLEYVKTKEEYNVELLDIYSVATWNVCFYSFIKDKVNIDNINTKDMLYLLSVISKMHLDCNNEPEFYPDVFTIKRVVNTWNLCYNNLLRNDDICSSDEEEEDLKKSITLFRNARNLKCESPSTTCQGCIENQPNQLAHMAVGGCLY